MQRTPVCQETLAPIPGAHNAHAPCVLLRVSAIIDFDITCSNVTSNNLGGVNCDKVGGASCDMPNEIRYSGVGRVEYADNSGTFLDLVVTNTTFYEHWNPAINGHAP